MAFGTVPALAGSDRAGPAARLSATLGGTLDCDMGEAGSLSHPIDYGAITLYPGRAVEYRRRVALEMRLAVRSAPAAPPPPASR